jgi:glycosyltransferase involved in cell wall biosynthesis
LRSSPAVRVSVIICNHNYEAFVSQAIASALALDWPDLEVIVVDDGSTDASRDVIAEYADRVTVIHQAKSGQWAACNAGYARSTGEVVIFLDSDDLLEPSVARELSSVWRPGISKVQFQMRVVDEHGRPTGALLPQFTEVPSSEQIRRWALCTGAYPTPPGSGNAYARTFLDRLFPLNGGDRAADSYCLAAAPYLGDVVTIAKPLVAYRVHGRNQGAMASLDPRRFSFELERARFRLNYARSVAPQVDVPSWERALKRSLGLLPYRLASLKLLPEQHPVVGDSALNVLCDVTAACFAPQGVSPRARVALWLWALSVAAAPRELGERLALWRFSSGSRPELLKRSLRLLGVVARYQAT